MIIGNLTYNEADSTFTGGFITLTIVARDLVFQPTEATTEGAPDYRVVSPTPAGDVEFGAAWWQNSKDGHDYLSVKLDDPALSQPVNCALVASKDEAGKFLLVWSRRKPEDGKTKPAKKPVARKKAA